MKRLRLPFRSHSERPVTDEPTGPMPEAPDDAPEQRQPRLGRRIIRIAKIGALVAAVLVGTFVAAAVAFGLYDVYGPHPDNTAASWAAHTPQFAGTTVCLECHAQEYAEEEASNHQTVACESCHGPLAAHATASPPTPVEVSTADEQCATCHVAVTGRAASFPQINTTTHYGVGSCLRCHGAHSVVAVAPPLVPHPLTNLPACTTCHKPEGLKSVPAGHVEAPDAVCLSCHKVEAASR